MKAGNIQLGKVFKMSFLFIVTGFVLIPLVATLLGGFKSYGELRVAPFGLPSEWNTEFFIEILTASSFWHYLFNSLVIGLCSVALTLITGAMAAFVFAHIRFFGSKMLFSYFLMGMMFPFATAILPLFIKVRDLGLLDTYLGVILPGTAFGLGFSIMLFKTFFEQLPRELFEAAHMDGCSYVRFFFRFTLPLSVPILATVGVFSFVTNWNCFLLPLVVLNDRELFTWPLGLMQYRGEFMVEWNRILAYLTLTMAPAIAFFFLAQRYIVAGLTGGAVKG